MEFFNRPKIKENKDSAQTTSLLRIKSVGYTGECLSPYSARRTELEFLQLFSIILFTAVDMKCQLCCNILMGVTVLNCGHCFCSFCITSWLQQNDNCPTCLKGLVQLQCLRCFQLEGVTETLHEKILDIFKTHNSKSKFKYSTGQFPTSGTISFNTGLSVPQQNDLRTKLSHTNSLSEQLIFQSQKQIADLFRTRSQIKANRNGQTSCDISTRTMLHGLVDLGFELRQSIPGFFLIFTGCFILTVSAGYIGDALEVFGLTILRRLLYSIVVVQLLATSQEMIFRFFFNEVFWEQMIITKVVERPKKPFNCETKNLISSIMKNNFVKKFAEESKGLLLKIYMAQRDINK